MKQYFLFFSLLFSQSIFAQQKLDITQANRLVKLPLKCLQQEYPNKLSQLLLDSTEIQSPKALHPSFYGCFDWHSSVHGHWSVVFLLNRFPDLEAKNELIQKLKINLSKQNITTEIRYFEKKHEKSFERMYGWTWLLKLQEELSKSTEKELIELAANLQPLSDLIVKRYLEFLPKLTYPIRIGTHGNAAFGMSFAYDYAVFSGRKELKTVIEETAKRFYLNDQQYDLSWEPSGFDFLSQAFCEIELMERILPKEAFFSWLKKFNKSILKSNFKWNVAEVSDRTDGHLVHLDGLNLSRAWGMYRLIQKYPKEFSHLKPIADAHFQQANKSLVDGNYEGEHWLASFALYVYEVLEK